MNVIESMAINMIASAAPSFLTPELSAELVVLGKAHPLQAKTLLLGIQTAAAALEPLEVGALAPLVTALVNMFKAAAVSAAATEGITLS